MISDDFIFNESSDKIVFQFAWDQVVKRFGSEENADLFVDNMMEVAKSLISSGMRVLIVSHTNRDIDRSDAICSKWSSKGVKCEHISLVKSPAHEISLFYYGVNTVFAMRGHSQMIPMGLGCKIVSLISHDKVLGLIEDLSIEETGVEVLDKDFTDKCLECYNTCHATDFSKAIDKARNNININMDRIKRGLKNG
jgi:polysaccharide pyruvyl transferase WcaK-like protein